MTLQLTNRNHESSVLSFWNQFPHCGYPKRSECEIVQGLVASGIFFGEKSRHI